MPELPEVETMVRGVKPHLSGRTIRTTRFCPCSRKPITISPERPKFQQALRGRVIEDVFRLAKRIVIQLDNDLSLVVEPRMTGLLLVTQPPTQEHRRLQWKLTPVTGQPDSFEFWDRRGLGTVRLLNPEQLTDVKRRLGPDPLDMTNEQWREQLARTSRPVKAALLDPKLVVGIGNIYASEILHRAGISPTAAASSLSRQRIRRLADASQKILLEAI